MKRLFVDTGAWFAFFNEADPDHSSVSEVLMEWEGNLVTSDYVFDEIITLLRYRVSHKIACSTGKALREGGIAVLLTVDHSDMEEAWRRFVVEDDKRYSFTDCVSFALMGRMRLDTAVAVDADFRRAGFTVLPSSLNVRRVGECVEPYRSKESISIGSKGKSRLRADAV